MHKTLITAVMAIATLSSSFATAQPMQGPPGHHGGQGPQGRQMAGDCYVGESSHDCRERLSVQRRNRHEYVWQNGRYEERDPSGQTVAAGIIGFILGAAIAGSTSDRDYYHAHRNDNGWRTRCRSTYRSFDYNTGTYIGRDGYRHYCTR
jgi:hypothetical protein